MRLSAIHGLVDRLAMWSEDWIERPPQPYRPTSPAPLRCFGELPRLPAGPARPGPWSAPSPLPAASRDRMGLTFFAAPRRSRGTALLVPPWKTASTRLVAGYVYLLLRSGHDVWLLSPPHHLERTAPGSRSGEGFVSLDLERLRAVFEQLVLEIRVCAALAGRRGEVTLVGLSLGALGAALALTASERVDRAALVAPPADLCAVLSRTAIGRRYRALAERAGAPLPQREALRELLAFADPSGRRPCTRRVFLAIGAHDAIALPYGALRLARAWDIAPRLYDRGHITLLFGCRELRRDLASFAAEPAEPAAEAAEIA